MTTQAIAIGERVKRGVFRPCLETIPTSTIIGCLREHFGLEGAVAIGFFDSETYQKRLFTYAPFDSAIGTAKLPLTLEYLAPQKVGKEITAQVYVTATPEARSSFAKGEVHVVAMGALRSKGFGRCQLQFVEEVQPGRKVGYLRGSLRETDAPAFGIAPERDVVRPVYGYLFRPDSYHIGGRYERALTAGTILDGPDFLMDEEAYPYDR